MAGFQAFYADRHGDSVIIEGDDIVYREGDFQVVTNFIQTHPELGWYPCSRYETAVSMLENMTDLSVDYFTSICNSTHVAKTIHSNIYDLRQEKIWIYYMQDFNRVVEIDLNEELTKGEKRIYLGSLFEPEGNQPPEKPDAPTGEISGLPGEDFVYKANKTTDPNDDPMMYLFDWGDSSDTNWIKPSVMGGIKASHNWTERGDYEVRVKAMDMYGAESDWSDPLIVTMPKNKPINVLFFRFLEKHPHLFPLLRQLPKL